MKNKETNIVERIEDREMLDALEKALKCEQSRPPNTYCTGCGVQAFNTPQVPNNWHCEKCGFPNSYLAWEWHDVAQDHFVPRRLLKAGLAEITMKSNNHTHYALIDREKVKRVLEKSKEDNYGLEEYEADVENKTQFRQYTEQELDNLFSDIVGYESVKKLFKKAIIKNLNKNMLLIGPPASAKTLFQLSMDKLDGSVFVTGSNLSKAGLTDLLFNKDIRYLLIDEIEEVKPEDQDVLLTLLSTGKLTETKFGKTREKTMDLMVVASCNTTKRMKPQLRSRFLEISFEPYTEDEFVEISTNLLAKNGKDKELATKIAQNVWQQVSEPDVRDVLQVSDFIDSEDEIPEVLDTITGKKR